MLQRESGGCKKHSDYMQWLTEYNEVGKTESRMTEELGLRATLLVLLEIVQTSRVSFSSMFGE